MDFTPLPDDRNKTGQALSSDLNNSTDVQVKFEDVREDVLEKVTAQDEKDAQLEGVRLSQAAALDFLDQLNELSDDLFRTYNNYQEVRDSEEVKNLIADSGAVEKKFSFTRKDMNVQAMILGLERRASEKQSNREPLEEVEKLDQKKFFSRSVRKARKGHAVFILDRKSIKQAMEFDKVPFSTLCREFLTNLDGEAFNARSSEMLTLLNADKPSGFTKYSIYSFEKMNFPKAQSTFDVRRRSVQAKIDKLEKRKGDPNKESQKALPSVENKIAELRSTLEKLGTERNFVTKFFEECFCTFS